MNEPDCDKCKHCGSVPGSAHISCQHPEAQSNLAEPFGQLLSIFASAGRTAPVIGSSASVLNIKANPVGVRKGWFNFPYNFDPVWLENCDGFEAKP